MSRSSYYYQPSEADSSDLVIMRAIDELHLDYPFYGYRRITAELQDILETSYLPINGKKVRRLMQMMGICAIYPKENLSKKNLARKIYPYLLRHVPITHVRKVYSTDITYVPMAKGFMYLTAVIDWYSRYILAWRLSNTLTVDFCIEAVQEAFNKHGVPEIFNTDQGSQYTAQAFIKLLKDHQVSISMDGRGRALDNIFIERFWRTIKREHIYLFAHESGAELYKGLSQYITYVPMAKGFMYLTAVIDWYSRYILAWRLSNTLTVDFCIEAVQEAFNKHGVPEIFNTDQGSQYTAQAFIR